MARTTKPTTETIDKAIGQVVETSVAPVEESKTELIEITIKDKFTTCIYIKNASVSFNDGKARVTQETLNALKENGIEVN